MVQGLQWTVLLGVQVSIILASNGFQIYTVSLVRLQWYKKEWLFSMVPFQMCPQILWTKGCMSWAVGLHVHCTLRAPLWLWQRTLSYWLHPFLHSAESDGNSRENQLNFSRSTLRNHFLFLVLVSKHENDKIVFPFSSRKMRFSFKFLEKKDIWF